MNRNNPCPTCGIELPEDAPSGICPQCLLLAGLEDQSESAKSNKSEFLRNGGRNSTTARTGLFTPPSPDEVAQILPNLEVIELLGQGGMGAVYKARQTKLDRVVAVKVLPPEIESAPAFSERFNREARTLARLSHANIVSVYDYGESEGICFIVMEYIDGANLRQLIADGQLSPEQALAIVPQICDALQYAHGEGVVHRDVKPENILVDREGNVKIADFGLAKLLDNQIPNQFLTGTHQVMGTPHYMAPEQLQGTRTVDHRADIYSLGVVFYELLTGELPIGNFEPPSRKVQVDVRLDEVVLRALENEPARRYQKASEVQHDIESLSELPPPQKQVSPKPNPYDESATISDQLKLPAKALISVGIFNWILMPVCIALVAYYLGDQYANNADVKWVTFSVFAAGILMVSTIASSIMIVGGLKLLKLKPSRWTKYGAWAAILLMPGNLIGLPIGIWVLVSLASIEAQSKLGKTVNHGNVSKRIYSRKAIIGACWAPFFMLAAFMFLSTSTRIEDGNSPVEQTKEVWDKDGHLTVIRAESDNTVPVKRSGTDPLLLFVAMTAGLIGLSAPFGTTILGFVATSDIRHSKGRIVGMPLAVADALLFPLLILDILLAVIVARIVYLIGSAAENAGWQTMSDSVAFSIILLVTLPVCIYVDYLIVRSFWRRSKAQAD